MKLPDNKCKRRKMIYLTQEAKTFSQRYNKETQQETLDRIGYRQESEYKDTVSYLAW